jgi:hypothetical protein
MTMQYIHCRLIKMRSYQTEWSKKKKKEKRGNVILYMSWNICWRYLVPGHLPDPGVYLATPRSTPAARDGLWKGSNITQMWTYKMS